MTDISQLAYLYKGEPIDVSVPADTARIHLPFTVTNQQMHDIRAAFEVIFPGHGLMLSALVVITGDLQEEQ
jgi:hypothetical protein